jgi:small ubiquitin-related modifier
MEQQLTIRVKDQSGEETFFKIKRSVCMGKIMAYAQRKGILFDIYAFYLMEK